MTQTLKKYEENKLKLIDLLVRLEQFIAGGVNFGMKIAPEIEKKINISKSYLKEDKLRISLIGGFSEGKTSIAAAWLGKVDPKTMNISSSESSNEVSYYDHEDYILVDTPGLYGYKERHNDEGSVQKYKDITKHYVSESHIVLYVMNSKNPIKESHKEDLNWLFRDLNLLSRSVFILGRFDEVADVEDENDYQINLKIKRENVVERLQSMLNLDESEVNSLKIVAVSANPFDEGVDYWLDNIEEFKKLSHIGLLQDATLQVIEDKGGYGSLVEETQKTIISEILTKELPKVEETLNAFSLELNKLEELSELESRELDLISKKIVTAQSSLKNTLNRFFSDIQLQLIGCDIETIEEFLIREIGNEGCIFLEEINRIFVNEIDSINTSLNNNALRFEAEIDSIDSAYSSLAKEGITKLAKNIKIDAATIKLARDGLVAGAKIIGVNLKDALKFNPWGAVKLAGNVNKAIPLIGLGFEIWDSWSQAQRQAEFQAAKEKLLSDIETQQKNLLEHINSEEFIDSYFPVYIKLKTKIQEIIEMKSQNDIKMEEFKKWSKEGALIEGEFKAI